MLTLNSCNKYPVCRLCRLDNESAAHIITDCEVLWPERVDTFKQRFLDKQKPKWDACGVVDQSSLLKQQLHKPNLLMSNLIKLWTI